MSSWNDAKTQATSRANASNGLFVRLQNNGDKIVGAFVGEPYARDVVWTGERYETLDAANPAHGGKRGSFRVSLNFWDSAERKMKIIEGGLAWFKDVLKVRDKYGLDDWTFEIERHGDSGDPKTTYTILPDTRISDEDKKAIASARLNDLTGGSKDAFDSYNPDAKPSEDEEKTLRDGLVADLKRLPRGMVDEFLRVMGVAKVRDIEASKLAAARERVAGILKASEPPAEIDPFA